jgi:integrase
MSGHVRQRGRKGQWYAVIDVVTDGKRKRVWHRLNVAGKREAERACAGLITKQSEGTYVEPSRTTVAEFVRSRIDQWEAAKDITARSAEGYRRYVTNQIAPHINKPLQKLAPLDIEAWHTALRNSGLAARTIGHAHRLLGTALRDAEKYGLVTKNVARTQRAPRVSETEMAVVQDVPAFISALRVSQRFYAPAMIGLFAGMRLSEILALRWSRVDLDRGIIRVVEALEQTRAGIGFKEPKSKAGKRDISLPDILIDVLREHRKSQLELRMQLGLGRPPEDALLFSDLEGGPLAPNAMSARFSEFTKSIGLPEIGFHSLRHTHASRLLADGVNVVAVSKRLGHSKPDITLRAHPQSLAS